MEKRAADFLRYDGLNNENSLKFEQTTVASVQSIYVMAVSKEFIVSIQIV